MLAEEIATEDGYLRYVRVDALIDYVCSRLDEIRNKKSIICTLAVEKFVDRLINDIGELK